ncbi:glutamine synthetase [Corynebacterium sp. TAE3-ERU16]|uniref:glutamine synthetase n=1 Tax=Corynebacterium sp. TAE3-ERU16 TaxID=2849493 RepID=UPI001C437E41|nr:glutamine synthetase [Corynebacterium sp. TAE3-ERU16]
MRVTPDWYSARPDSDDKDLVWVPGNVDAPSAPRTVLARQLKELENIGLIPSVGIENEFTLFGPPHTAAASSGAPATTVGGDYGLGQTTELHALLSDVAERASHASLAIDNYRCECHPGQCEIVLRHSDALTACDDALILQHIVRRTATQRGYTASYLAAPATREGNSCHVHISLSPATDDGNYSRNVELLESFVAGIVEMLPSLGPVFSPTVNGWTRLRTAPFAPNAATWGVDDRTAAVRLIGISTGEPRCEVRIAGADSQPHLLVAGLLASGRWGITSERVLAGPSGSGQPIPQTPEQGLEAWKGNRTLTELLGRELVETISCAASAAIDDRLNAVTDHDYARDQERS